MARPLNLQEMEQLNQLILSQPGLPIGELARELNWSCEKVTRMLVSLNDRKVFYSEDTEGGLWPFTSEM